MDIFLYLWELSREWRELKKQLDLWCECDSDKRQGHQQKTSVHEGDKEKVKRQRCGTVLDSFH